MDTESEVTIRDITHTRTVKHMHPGFSIAILMMIMTMIRILTKSNIMSK